MKLYNQKRKIINDYSVYYLPSSHSSIHSKNRQSTRYIALKRKRAIGAIVGATITLVMGIIAVMVSIHIIGRAIDTSIDNQNTMLCNSAKVSGNEEYTKKCQSYYKDGDITYMRYE